MPIGMPGWPDLAASTASMASARIALASSASVALAVTEESIGSGKLYSADDSSSRSAPRRSSKLRASPKTAARATGSCLPATSCWSSWGRPSARATTRDSARGRLLRACRCKKTTISGGPSASRTLYLGRLGGVDCWAAELPADAAAPAGLSWEGLRPLFSVLDDDHFALAGRALQLAAMGPRPPVLRPLRHADAGETRRARARLPRLQAFGLPARGAGGDGARS